MIMTHREWAEANALALRLVLNEVRNGGDSTRDDEWAQNAQAVVAEAVAHPEQIVRVMAALAAIAASEMLGGWNGRKNRDPDVVASRVEAELEGMLDALATVARDEESDDQ